MKHGIEEDTLRKYLPLTEGYSRARLTRIEDAEDLSQETAYQVIRSWNRFQHRAAESTRIYAICRNILTAYLRQRNRDVKGNTDPHPSVASQEERQTIEFAFESMDSKYRRLYELYYRRDYTVREIAQYLAEPEGTVKYELYMLRRRARKLLE